MNGIDATFDDLSFEGGDSPRRVLLKVLPGATAVVLAGALGVWLLHWRGGGAPDAISWTPAPTARAVSKPFRDIAIDASLLAQLKTPIPAAQSARPAQVASLEAAPRVVPPPIPLPALEPFSPAPGPAPAIAPVASLPQPPAREAPEIGATESYPLPPPRPPELAAPGQPQAPEKRHLSRPEVARLPTPAAAPADNRNLLQKLFGWGRQTSPAGASPIVAYAAPPRATQTAVGEQTEREATGVGRGPLFGLPSPFGRSAPAAVSGYDRTTAVYDIKARTVYLPDGRKLEAHSGLGEALDNPRYVSERAKGPTPPHLYQLTLRESLFHGVQALRLNPIGEGGIYGRAGLLAHPFMLGPNGDSNGCVSVKDYQAFLKAYQNGQITKLAVVAGL
jgi:type VI secretion system (T6SS) effector TldE1-like protein